MKMDDQKLLLNIFDVPQCDRTEEGDAFTPPDPNLEYIVKVRSLVGEERFSDNASFESRYSASGSFRLGSAGA